MASQLSNVLDLAARLRESARRGDWKSTAELAADLSQQTLPKDREGLGEYLLHLKDVLIAAKMSRAHAAESLARINTAAVRLKAASKFNNTRVSFASSRQEFGEAADF